VHQLQACAREAGFEVAILYMNARYAALVDPMVYAALCNAPVHWLLGERLFARAAYGAPPLGYRTEGFLAEVDAHNRLAPSNSSGAVFEGPDFQYDRDLLFRIEAQAFALAEQLAVAIASRGYRFVGATSTFDQTSAGIALLQRVKAANPEVITVMGGANCDQEMAGGVRSLTDGVDYVFSGEADAAFVRFLRACGAGEPPPTPIIQGAPCTDLDALPTTSFADYFAQVPTEFGDAPLWVAYETSRGCWWGAKQHCTFCGLNGVGMRFRQKSPDRVVEQLRAILAEAPTHRVFMTDNIMPHPYHQTLIPRLPEVLPEITVFYEQKANLTLAQVKNLFDAGCRSIQAGIEALDSDLLRLMRKGLLARQNVALLRYARSVGMITLWNLLWGFPGDDAESYRRTAALLPVLRHLNPPQALAHLHLHRFSPYFERPEEYGITDTRPLSGYAEVFPEHADLGRLAHHFQASYSSGSEAPGVIQGLFEEVEHWRTLWEGDPRSAPMLHLRRSGPGSYLLTDTRGLGAAPVFQLNEAQAHAVLVGGRDRGAAGEWAIRNRFAVDLDGWCVPLATASYRLLSEFESQSRGLQTGAETLRMVPRPK
jgi:ribosomal peptide maturation radical SAM protein 1